MSDLIVDFPTHPIVSRRKRTVTFSNVCSIQLIQSEKDNKMMWYSSSDYKAMRVANKQAVLDAHQTVNTMRSSIAKPQDATKDELETCCMFVGIENMLTLTAIKRTRARRVQRSTLVLQEHEGQVRAGVSDPDRLAFVAQHCSRSAVTRAHAIGMLHSM